MEKSKTLVLGASENPERYSNLAVNKLLSKGYSVLAIGKKKGKVQDVIIETEQKLYTNIDTVTLYLNPSNQKPYYSYLLSLKPRRIIFNPGTENPELSSLAKEQGIQVQEACTLVLLSTAQY